MRNIYLVVGSYGMGEWDHNEWNVAIYDSEEAAETHADNANKYKGYQQQPINLDIFRHNWRNK